MPDECNVRKICCAYAVRTYAADKIYATCTYILKFPLKNKLGYTSGFKKTAQLI